LACPEVLLEGPDATKKRDRAERRPDEVRVRYEIRAVGNLKPGQPPVPDNGRRTLRDDERSDQAAYQGTRDRWAMSGSSDDKLAVAGHVQAGPFGLTASCRASTATVVGHRWLPRLQVATRVSRSARGPHPGRRSARSRLFRSVRSLQENFWTGQRRCPVESSPGSADL